MTLQDDKFPLEFEISLINIITIINFERFDHYCVTLTIRYHNVIGTCTCSNQCPIGTQVYTVYIFISCLCIKIEKDRRITSNFSI